MKYVCIDYQNCDYYEYLDPQDLIDLDLVHFCPNCNNLTVLVSNDFNIKEILEEPIRVLLYDEE